MGSLSYTDPQFLAFANSTGLAEDVQDYHTSVSEEAEKLRKEKEKDLNSMTPSEMVAKYGANDPDVKKRINDINNGISWTSIGTGLISSTAMLGKEALSSKISDEVAKKIASDIVDTVKNNTTTFDNKSTYTIHTFGEHEQMLAFLFSVYYDNAFYSTNEIARHKKQTTYQYTLNKKLKNKYNPNFIKRKVKK